jgi:hypothetical protein
MDQSLLATLHIADLQVSDRVIVAVLVIDSLILGRLRLGLGLGVLGSRLIVFIQLALAGHLAERTFAALDTCLVLLAVLALTGTLGWGCVPRDLSTKEVVDHHLGDTIQISFTSLEETTTLAGKKREPVEVVLLVLDTVCTLKVTGQDTAKNGRNVLLWVVNVLHSADTTEKNVLLGVIDVGRDHTRTIDEIDSLHQGDVLPHLGFTRNGSNCAHLLGSESVDDGRLARVGVADQANRHLLAVGVKGRELAKQRDQRTLAERVVDVGMESKTRIILRKMTNPSGLVKDAKLAISHQQ